MLSKSWLPLKGYVQHSHILKCFIFQDSVITEKSFVSLCSNFQFLNGLNEGTTLSPSVHWFHSQQCKGQLFSPTAHWSYSKITLVSSQRGMSHTAHESFSVYLGVPDCMIMGYSTNMGCGSNGLLYHGPQYKWAIQV